MFPFVSVVECPEKEMLGRIGPTLVGTVLTQNEAFIQSAGVCGNRPSQFRPDSNKSIELAAAS